MLRGCASDAELTGAIWSVIVDLANNDGLIGIVDIHVDTNERTVFAASQVGTKQHRLTFVGNGVIRSMFLCRVTRDIWHVVEVVLIAHIRTEARTRRKLV